MDEKKKLPSSFANMVIVLSVTALLSALALAFTYTVTLETRAQVELKKTEAALKKVLPEYDNNPAAEAFQHPGMPGIEYYPAKKDGQLSGMAVKTYSNNGFSDQVLLMVGFDKDQRIINIEVLSQRETPGLGTRMTESRFKNQFSGKHPDTFRLEVRKKGGDVDAITAATISSRAFCDAVNRAYWALKPVLGGGED